MNNELENRPDLRDTADILHRAATAVQGKTTEELKYILSQLSPAERVGLSSILSAGEVRTTSTITASKGFNAEVKAGVFWQIIIRSGKASERWHKCLRIFMQKQECDQNWLKAGESFLKQGIVKYRLK